MRRRRSTRNAMLLFASVALSASGVSAQESSGNGFLFGAPSGSLTFRVGYAGAAASSDLFKFVTNELTLRSGDFSSFGYGGDLAFAVRPRWDVIVSADVSGMDKKSEFRDWQDTDGKPIEQTTAFSRQSLAVGLKYYVLPYGRTLGKFAWVPARYAPWLSASVGRTLYTFKQDGDFIDFNNNNRVFRDTFDSSEWGNTAQLAAGLDWNITQRFALTTQAKYLWGKADLGVDFSGFGPIDLSGVGMTGGVTIRF